MTTSDYMNVRHAVVTLVLATDLAHHFGFVEKLKLTTTDHSTGFRGSSGSTNERQKYVDMQLSLGAQNVDNMTVMKIAIKLSDIGKVKVKMKIQTQMFVCSVPIQLNMFFLGLFIPTHPMKTTNRSLCQRIVVAFKMV